MIEISPEQLEQLNGAAADGPRDEIVRLLAELPLEPVGRRLHHFAHQARQLAERLGKKANVEIRHDGLRLDRSSWAPVWTVLAHALGNALDHGIEAPVERLAAGKSEAGHIVLSARKTDGRVIVQVLDDGRGLDWDALRISRKAKGLPAGSREELLQGMFAEGVSTAREITDISGRGVGMGALRAAARAMGGDVVLQSELGRGTELQFVVPVSSLGLQDGVRKVIADLRPSSRGRCDSAPPFGSARPRAGTGHESHRKAGPLVCKRSRTAACELALVRTRPAGSGRKSRRTFRPPR